MAVKAFSQYKCDTSSKHDKCKNQEFGRLVEVCIKYETH